MGNLFAQRSSTDGVNRQMIIALDVLHGMRGPQLRLILPSRRHIRRMMVSSKALGINTAEYQANLPSNHEIDRDSCSSP